MPKSFDIFEKLKIKESDNYIRIFQCGFYEEGKQ